MITCSHPETNNRGDPQGFAPTPLSNYDHSPPKLNPREQTVLFAVGDRRTYGLEIQSHIEHCTDRRTKITIGTLYPLLRSLEKKGLLTGENEPGSKRRYYTITPLGRQYIEGILYTQYRLLGMVE